MSTNRRVTIYFDPEVYRAVKVKAASLDRTLSDVVNEAVRRSLAEDAEDLEAFEKRAGEPDLSFERIMKDLKRRGRL